MKINNFTPLNFNKINNKTLNIDVTPIYYNMLAECFEKPISK